MAFQAFQDDFPGGALHSRWAAPTDGNGTVTVASSVALIDCNGAADDDVAALVLKEPLAFSTTDWICKIGLRIDNPAESAYVPPLAWIIDETGEPTVMTAAQRNSRRRAYFENQINDGVTNSSRIQAKFRNPSGTIYNWDNSGAAWSSAFKYSWRNAGPFGLTVLTFYWKNGTGLKWTGYQIDDYLSSGEVGCRGGMDTEFRTFGTGSTQIDEIDNDAYLVIGDLANDDSDTEDRVLHVEFVTMSEVEKVNSEMLYTAGQPSGSAYDIYEWVCPKEDIENGYALYTPAQAEHPDNPVVAKGSDDFVQDPYVYDDVNDSS